MKTAASILFLFVTISLANALPPLQFQTSDLQPQTFTPPRWEKLGERKVNYSADRDEIFVTAREGRFTALKIMVKKGGINMHKLVVHFGDGSSEELELRNEIPAGGESRVIDLPGKRRVIHHVVFWYDTKNFADRKAVVELWGRH